MKTTMKAVVVVTCVLFVSVMLRMQYGTFADRATRGVLLSAAPSSSSSPAGLSAAIRNSRSGAPALASAASSSVVNVRTILEAPAVSP